ncbi:MAG: hypothetical protein ABSG67_01485 [Thermoguttaceae bacterium]|jgi:hypothetical protein
MSNFEGMELRRNKRFLDLQAAFEGAFESLSYKFHFDGLKLNEAINQVAERFDKLIQSAAGPVFDKEGYIPPIQACTDAEVDRWFGFGDYRQMRLLGRVRMWIRLARAVKARRLLLDGSFVTVKVEPGDVDAVVLLPEDFRDQLNRDNPEAHELVKMFLTREPNELFAAEDEEDWWGWFEFFSRTREASGRRKGLIEVIL